MTQTQENQVQGGGGRGGARRRRAAASRQQGGRGGAPGAAARTQTKQWWLEYDFATGTVVLNDKYKPEKPQSDLGDRVARQEDRRSSRADTTCS